jgi:hypothetical protein
MLDTRSRPTDTDWLGAAEARFNAANDSLTLKTVGLLNQVIGDIALHARFINTLSMLEHMGSFKIMSTQHGADIEQATLRHVTEECHHAFFMKRQAEKAAGRPLEYRAADLLCPVPARMYFQRLEAAMHRDLADSPDNRTIYLYMSMIVEFRAVWFYSLYQQALVRHDHAMSLKRLLGEEQNHLTDMAERLEQAGELSDDRVDRFTRAEHGLYARLLDAMHRAIN